jgi:hypothetical protein
VLALSPLHIYYSQEARMYGLVVFLIALSYLALVSFNVTPSWRWAAVYGVSVAVALYADYSAAFALLPQAILIAMLIDRHRRASVPIFVACLSALVTYLPWAPQVIDSVHAANEVARRDAYLGVDSSRVPTVLLAFVGLAGDGSYFQSTRAMPWDAWPSLRALMLVALLPIIALGVVALVRRPLAGVVTMCLFGSIAVAMWTSLISPSFAERTVLSATLGWALLVGAAFADRLSGMRAAIVLFSLGCSLILAVFSLQVIETNASKQRWSDVSSDVALVSSLPMPIATYSYAEVANTLIDVYQPGALDDARLITIHDGELEAALSQGHYSTNGLSRADVLAGKLADVLPKADPANHVLWYVSYPRNGNQDVLTQINRLGYEQILHREYWDPRYLVFLDLFALPGAHVGPEIDVNGAFAADAAGWTLPSKGITIVPDDETRAHIVIQNDGFSSPAATLHIPAAGAALYEVTVEVETELEASSVGVALACLSATDEVLAESRLEPVLTTVDPAGWRAVRLATLCPRETASVRMSLSTEAPGAVAFRDIHFFAQPIE